MRKLDTRKTKVVFISDETKASFDKLKSGKYEDAQLYEFINRAIYDLKENPFIGIKLPAKLWPREYILQYRINNLWKYDLPNGWRLIYFLRGDDVEIVSIILEWFDHKKYERRFGY